MLGSVAGLALASLIIAAPSFAQNWSEESSPAETARTQELNQLQATEPGVSVDPAAQYSYETAQAQYGDQQAQYNKELQDYQAKKNEYDEQNRNYEGQRGTYQSQLDTYGDQAEAYGDEAQAYADQPAGQLLAIDEVADPDAELFNAPVEDPTGYVVGHFRRVTFQDEGRPEAVITLHNNKTVVVPQEYLQFDPDRGAVLSDLSYDELLSMPARF
jgi:hypothetical protein